MSSCTSAACAVSASDISLACHVHQGGAGGSAAFAGANSWDIFKNTDNTPEAMRGTWDVCDPTTNQSVFYICGGSCAIGTTTACWLLKVQINGGYWTVGGGASTKCFIQNFDGILWKCNNECCWRYAMHTATFEGTQNGERGCFKCGITCTNGTSVTFPTNGGGGFNFRVWDTCAAFCFSSLTIGGVSVSDQTVT